MSRKVKITFCSGAHEVTGANFLFEVYPSTGSGRPSRKYLIDCGLIQGSKMAERENWEPFSYDPTQIDYLFITHAHIDHVGRIPKIINDGFKGQIFSTLPTREIAKFMIEDTGNILGKDKLDGLDKIYSKENFEKAFSLWKGFEYHETIKLDEGVTVTFRDAGHILGSAMAEFNVDGKKFVFTGDLGNSPSPLLKDTEMLSDTDYLIMESVYGDRNHESRDQRKDMLEDAIEDTVKRKGVLLMPTFSLERSQELLFEIDSMIEGNRIPLTPVFLDSPLAIKLTSVFKKFSYCFNDKINEMIKKGNDIFMFPGLLSTEETEQSKMIVRMAKPKVIIAGSGMSSGGRIVHHEKAYLPDSNNMLLLTGYQTPGTLGWHIQNGEKTVRIAGEEITVRAEVRRIDGYSGHKDSDNLLKFVQNTSETIKKVFVVMGEPKSSMFLAQKLRDNLGIDAYVPEKGESVEIEL
ncbi:MAG: Beta-lactamase domain protein [Candidatus Nomurabacteria bacterium GW2011_GWB1_37_5]|uniref:Beta-lactamase domain protein n=1 Tax=Candidatus Nomurabacteria bacterium GW2011_GWB1_37_5 TaxID=1618742 RepID=A0A0G0JC56_9BACT|nr:MAG: Beta-lactamase domain protein [Candidatus Nomurabacteria bacterium GW2011_GWB1_37_5]